MEIRNAEVGDVSHLAKVWYDGWQDAHADILPAELRRVRTLESFAERLGAALAGVRTSGPTGAPAGFCMVKGDELYQLYVSAKSRGTGLAAALLTDSEDRMFRGGVETAWLACAIGNTRAARFYEKCGWHRAGTMINRLETTEGLFSLEVWRYEKPLRSAKES
jgi:GNAT superfamily N-acetyltransferase